MLGAQFEGEKSGSCNGGAQFGERRGFSGALMTSAMASGMGVGVGGYFGYVGVDEVDDDTQERDGVAAVYSYISVTTQISDDPKFGP